LIEMNDDRVVFALVLSGFALQAVAAMVMAGIGFWWFPFGAGFGMGMGMMGYYRAAAYPYVYGLLSIAVWVVWSLLVLALGTLAVYFLGKEKPDVALGSTFALIASVLAFPLMWGFFLGSLLMFIGSLIGLASRA